MKSNPGEDEAPDNEASLRELQSLIRVVTDANAASTPQSVSRTEACRRLASLSADYPMAVSQWTDELTDACVAEYRSPTGHSGANSVGEQLMVVLGNIAAVAPRTLVSHAEKLVSLFTPVAESEQKSLISALHAISQTSPEVLDCAEATNLADSFTKQAAVENAEYIDVIAEVVSIDRFRTTDVASTLIGLVELESTQIKKKAANALHEFALNDPTLLKDHVPQCSELVSHQDEEVSALGLYILTELTSVAPTQVAARLDELEAILDREKSVQSAILPLLLQVVVADPALLKQREHSLRLVLDQESKSHLVEGGCVVARVYVSGVSDIEPATQRALVRALPKVDTETKETILDTLLFLVDETAPPNRIELAPLIACCSNPNPTVRLQSVELLNWMYREYPGRVANAIESAEATLPECGPDTSWRTPRILRQLRVDAREAGGEIHQLNINWAAELPPTVGSYSSEGSITAYSRLAEIEDPNEAAAHMDELREILETGGVAAEFGLEQFSEVTNTHPQKAVYHVDAVLPYINDDEFTNRIIALSITHDVLHRAPRQLVDDIDRFVAVLEGQDILSRFSAASHILLLARYDTEPVGEIIGELVTAIGSNPPQLQHPLEAAIRIVALDHPDAVAPHLQELLQNIRPGLQTDVSEIGLDTALLNEEQTSPTILDASEVTGYVPEMDIYDSSVQLHRSAIMTTGRVVNSDPTVFDQIQEEIKSLLQSKTENERIFATKLLRSTALGTPAAVLPLLNIVSTIITEETTPDILEGLVTCVWLVAKEYPEQIAPYRSELLAAGQRWLNSTEIAASEMTFENLLYAVAAIVDFLEPNEYPDVRTVLEIAEHSQKPKPGLVILSHTPSRNRPQFFDERAQIHELLARSSWDGARIHAVESLKQTGSKVKLQGSPVR